MAVSKLHKFTEREIEVLSAAMPEIGLPALKKDVTDVHNISLYERAFHLGYDFTEEDLRRIAHHAVDDLK